MPKASRLTASNFVHLHNHTHYSVLDGLTKVPALVNLVKEYDMSAVAITDHGTLSGAIEFYTEAKEKGIKPIIGMEAYVAPRTNQDRDPSKDKNSYHLTILAMNHEGYLNLMQLSTIANLEGFYYRPRIDFELLKKYNAGLIVLSGCIGGEVADNLRANQDQQAEAVASKYKSLLGDRYYLEVQDHGHLKHPNYWEEQGRVNVGLLKLAKKLDIPAVVTCDAHYLKTEDKEAHEILLCVQTGSFLSDNNRMSLAEFDLSVTNPKKVIERWGDEYPELITNTKAIADRVDLKIQLDSILIPKFPVPAEEKGEGQYLEKLVYQGLVWRYNGETRDQIKDLSVAQAKRKLPAAILKRAEYELEVIGKMGFQGYFLIINDFIQWGKSQGIIFGPGRGSAAGSIVSYGLDITSLDPLKYDLLFERFLNPDRISMPDVDIDIMDTRRNEVIAYCADKYGHDRVANIVTFGTMAARNAVRDVSRVLQVPYAEADRLAKMIPPPIQGIHVPLKRSIQKNRDLKQEYETNAVARQVFDLATQLEGTIRSHGVHAAGVVIAPDEIVKYTPLEMAQKGVVATQYSMGPIEHLGLLKMDFLGLSNLTIIKNALRIIKRVYNEDIDIEKLPLDDAETYALFQRGDTTGVFQFESAGMRRYLKALQPTRFEDIVAMNALYRPGPMQFIDDFISRKRGEKEISFLHQSMEPALKNTYGVLVYQEQVMQISKDVCGFSGGEADTLRKAIGKKKIDILRKMRQRMIDGAKEVSGVEAATMEKFWQQLEDFAAYCFNKSHAACYSLIAYQTAYLKAHCPAAFMAALMTSVYVDTDRLALEISECQKMNIAVLPPDINESFSEFAVIENGDSSSIRFSLSAIKNVGSNAVDEILRAREAGPFLDFEDFLTRVDYKSVNRKSFESLIKAGVFDRFHERVLLLNSLDLIMAYGSRSQKQAERGQTDLFGGDSTKANQMPTARLNLPKPTPDQQMSREHLIWERELLGLYLSKHPLTLFESLLKDQAQPIVSLNSKMDNQAVKIGGIVNGIREITTKRGQKMAFVRVEDLSGDIEVILFPQTYAQFSNLCVLDKVVLMKGKLDAKDRDGRIGDELKIILDSADELSTDQAEAYHKPTGQILSGPGAKGASKAERLYIRLASSEDKTLLMDLKRTIDMYRGNTEVVLVLGDDQRKQAIKLPSGIEITSEGPKLLTQLMGSENVVVN